MVKCEWSACYDEHGNKKAGCDKPATDTLHGRKKDFHFCKEHFNQAMAFKKNVIEPIKKALGIDGVPYHQ